MTHDELSLKGAAWLRRIKRCRVVVTQKCIMTHEEPDVLGWVGRGLSWLIEVKMSRSDFTRDRHKPHRMLAGMGDFRYYLAPQGVIPVEIIPEPWGLLEWNGRKIVAVKKLDEQFTREKDCRDEIRRLLSLAIHRNFGCPQIEVVQISEPRGLSTDTRQTVLTGAVQGYG